MKQTTTIRNQQACQIIKIHNLILCITISYITTSKQKQPTQHSINSSRIKTTPYVKLKDPRIIVIHQSRIPLHKTLTKNQSKNLISLSSSSANNKYPQSETSNFSHHIAPQHVYALVQTSVRPLNCHSPIKTPKFKKQIKK